MKKSLLFGFKQIRSRYRGDRISLLASAFTRQTPEAVTLSFGPGSQQTTGSLKLPDKDSFLHHPTTYEIDGILSQRKNAVNAKYAIAVVFSLYFSPLFAFQEA